MAELNRLNCIGDLKNVGFSECFLDFLDIRGAIGVPPKKVFTKAELADLQNTLKTATTAAKSARIYPIHKFAGITDNSEDPVFFTAGYGKRRFVRKGNYIWLFQYFEGGICLSNALQSISTSTLRWLFYDANGIIIGTKKDDGTGQYGLGGIPLDNFVPYDWKAGDGSNPTQYRVLFEFEGKYVNQQLGWTKAEGFDLEDIKGLQNINLEQVGASAAGVIKLQAKAGCEGVNLYDTYDTELAAAAMWVATNAAGLPITITSVVADAVNKAFTITLDSASPNYPANAADKVIINTAAASVLAAADVVGYEGLPITVNRG
ncbi:hypothetical protein [Chitinophaga sp. YIM B06452]|uniref:hypothetical protein n=1 Tax=Chitinophaga sp. YIM B06452 TaxID=3082158 RepID=UPI0031FE9AF4